jgi:hypothetical protein
LPKIAPVLLIVASCAATLGKFQGDPATDAFADRPELKVRRGVLSWPLDKEVRQMDKKIAGLIAAVSVLGPLGAAQAQASTAEVDQVMTASSFQELLQPIPNAAAILKVVDDAQVNPAAAGDMQVAQHHHHHHHHHWYPRRHHHHHHHHYSG